MDEILMYVLGVAVCGALFVTFYRIALYGRVSFRAARIFLVGSLIASAVIPALDIPVWASAPVEIPYIMEPLAEFGPLPVAPVEVAVDWVKIGLWGLYGAGVAVLAAMMAWQMAGIRRIRRGAEMHVMGARLVAVSEAVSSPFSFLGTVYIPKETASGALRAGNPQTGELARIIAHEQSHIRHRHSVEKIVMQSITVLMWFSPAAWWAGRLLSEVHEFEADNDVLRGGCTIDEYMPLVFRQVFGVIPEISVGLGNSITKKRFEMMRKNLKHNKLSWPRVMGVLPVAAGMLALFGFTDRAPEVVVVGAPETTDPTIETVAGTTPEAEPTVIRIGGTSGEMDGVITVDGKTIDLKTIAEGGSYFATDGTDNVKVTMIDASSQSPDEPTYKAEVMPSFEGEGVQKFRNWVMMNIKYPQEAQDQGIGGRVVMQFSIGKDGTVTSAEALNSPSELLSEEVVRVIKTSPKWTPGSQDGKAVSVYYVMPVDFTVAGDGKEGKPTEDKPAGEVKNVTVKVVKDGEKVEMIGTSDGGVIVKALNGGKEPLFIVDGEEVTGGLDDLKATDIKSISVLKEASAVELYGEKAANGVVVIETKGGSPRADKSKKNDDKVDVGYREESRRTRSASVNKVDIEQDQADMAVDLRGYMQGRVAGVRFDGDKLIVRGRRSVNGDNEALIMINGVPSGSFEEANQIVNPRDIESVNVVGPTNIYGPRGANGVVLIKTKNQ